MNFKGFAATQARVLMLHISSRRILAAALRAASLAATDRDAIGSHRSAAVALEQQPILTPEHGADAGEEDDGPRRVVTLRRQRRSPGPSTRMGGAGTTPPRVRCVFRLMGSPGTVPLLVGDRGSAADVCIAQAAAHLPGAVAYAFVLMPSRVTGPTSDVGTSAPATYGSILALQGCRCVCRCDEENSGAHEGDREQKVPGHHHRTS